MGKKAWKVKCARAGMMTMALAFVACQTTNQREEVRPAAVRPAGQFTLAGMTQAIIEIETAKGEARKALQQRYEKDFRAAPKHPFKRFLWAYSLDDRNQAWQELSKVTKLNDRFLWAYLGMGIILDEWKVYDQAQTNFDLALKLGSKVALVHGRYGRMLLHKGDAASAMAALETGLRLSESVACRLDLARAQVAAGKQTEALSSYAMLAEKAPEDFVVQAERGTLLSQAGKKAEAIESLEIAAKIDPGAYPVRRQRAKLLVELQRQDEAVAAYQDACGVGKDDVCWRELAALGKAKSDLALQVQAYERLLEIIPEDVEAHSFLAPVYLEQGAIERALPSFRLVLREKPDDLDGTFGLGQLFEKGEEFTKSMEAYGRVLELKPDHEGASKALRGLFVRFHVLPEPITGKSPAKVFTLNQSHLSKVYKELLKQSPKLKGEMMLKVTVDEEGDVQGVVVAKDTVGHSGLSLCAEWNLLRSKFPAGFGATYDFALGLKPGSK